MSIRTLFELNVCLFSYIKTWYHLFTLIFNLFAAGGNKSPFISTAVFLLEEFPKPIAEQVTTLTKTFNNSEIWIN